ncbi:hypothetical protein H5410_020891 [Solanum commersonii]|uniref:Isopentenyltransferase n=1 Tax=Solanum commersonii TaxID=4109 RepID=A0A9J5ZAD7_SOLCO|nr:hypothetical protein H5410_020891 [Solanum commersonii]
MGATGTGKSRLSIDLANHFRGEIINSDKMQVYQRLEIVTNKITHTEKQGVRHYLLGLVDEGRHIFILDADYTKGIRRSIGVPKMDRYLRKETNIDEDDESKKKILQSSMADIKHNTRLLIFHQLDKIQRLINEKIWLVHHIIANAKLNTFINNKKFNKKKVVFIMGATGMGKSHLSVDLATHSRGEIINSDKMQVYKGLEILTKNIAHTEKQGQSVLNRRVDMWAYEMVNAGLVDEVRLIFIPDADYTKEIRRSIGVPEMDRYLREETNIDEDGE